MSKTPTINVLHIASGDLWAGAEVQLYTLAKALHERPDTKVSVVLLNHGTLEQKLLNNGIHTIILDETKLNGFQILLQLKSIVHQIQPDIIHTHRIKENILGSITAFLNKIPSLRTAHGAPEHIPRWFNVPKRLILFIDRLCATFLQKEIIAVSDDLADKLQTSYSRKKITVIENGIDISVITSTKTDSSDTFRIGIAGRLTPVKRVDIFIEAAAVFSEAHPEVDTSFHIFGDGPLRNNLETLSDRLGVAGNIAFEGHCENMQQELANLDVLLITSDHEGLPMILLEAMALEVPVIAHAVGGIPTVLDQGKCGVLVTEHMPSAYANAIYQLIHDPKLRHTCVTNAASRVKKRYSSTHNAQAYHMRYKRLIQNDI